MADEDDRVAAWRSLLLTYTQVVRAIEADLATRRLVPLGWYDVLLELNAAPGRRLRMQALAERVTLSRTRVSRMVAELEQAGLVERLPDAADGRATFAAITPQGRAELRKAAPHYLESIERHFTSALTDDERRTIVTALDRVRAERVDRVPR
jgi:DNA-binding MarR family transcriptional regulator